MVAVPGKDPAIRSGSALHMNIVEMIARSHNGHGLDVLGQQFGLNRQQTLEAVAELAPMVSSGVRRNTRADDGMVSLLEALSGGRHERYLEDDSAVQYDQVRDDGNAILGHLFGDKQVSREVAMHAAGSTGIGSAILKKMLPVIASMVLGAIFKRMTGGGRQPAPSPRGGSGGGLGDILGDILGGGQSRQTRLDPIPDPGTGGRGGSGGGSLDDLLRDVLGGGQQRAPQPQPRQRAPQQGGGLDDLLRDILGGGAPRQPRPRGGYNDDAVRRSRETIDDILSGDTTTRSGNAADDLLESVRRRTGQ
jgi:hypothetical protein